MIHIGVAALALAVSLLQLGVVPSLFLRPEQAPLLPVALLAGWVAVRGPSEAWAAILVAPVALGAGSEERVGWFLLALLPTAIAATVLPRGKQPSARTFVVRATAAAGVGAALYALTLAIASARLELSNDGLKAVGSAAVLTALLAASVAALLLPFRRRARGLFS